MLPRYSGGHSGERTYDIYKSKERHSQLSMVYCKYEKVFSRVIEEEQKILDIGLKQSRLHKKERTERFPTALHELLMEGLEEEQRY